MTVMKKVLNIGWTGRAKPRLFRRTRIVIAGCGNVGLRLIEQNRSKQGAIRLIATARRAEQAAVITNHGALALQGSLNDKVFTQRVARLADRFMLMAPPTAGQYHNNTDIISLFLACAMLGSQAHTLKKKRMEYVSTTGVYGDVKGRWIDETAPRQANSARAMKRVLAENIWIRFTRQGHGSSRIHRAPGIYALDRLPIARLEQRTPAIQTGEDSFSNHIHADDLARWVFTAQFKGPAGRAFNVVDEKPTPMGDYFDAVAQAAGLEKPPRFPREQVQRMVSPMLWSFMNESRRISNRRLMELGFKLRYKTTNEFLAQPNILSKLRSISD